MKTKFLTVSLCALFGISASGQGIFESASSQAQDENPNKTKLELNGFARGIVYGGSDDYEYSNVFGEFALKSKLVKQRAFFIADLRVRQGIFFNKRELQLQLKEAYAGYRSDRVDLFLGNQIVSWGRTDGFNPTNNITPNDYFFLTYEPDDQKLSNFLLRSKLKITNQIDFEIIAIPFYAPSNYRYDLFKMEGQATFLPIQEPGFKVDKGAIAVKLNFELPAVGLSASYFNGYDPFYGFTLAGITDNGISYLPTPYRKQTIGIDFAIPISSWIVRGEFGANITEDYQANMHVPNPDYSYVIGLEKSLFSTTAIFQYIGKYTVDFTPLQVPSFPDIPTPEAIQLYQYNMIVYESTQYNRRIFSQQEETNHALMLSLNRSFAHDQLNVELSGLYNITTEEHLVRGRIKWNMSDAVSANIGASYMKGPDKSIYKSAGRVMNGVFLGLEVGF